MAGNTPDSDLGSIECFQNYTAPEVFIQGLAGTVDQQDVECIIRAQKQMLQRFEKTNEMLSNCNTLCMTRLKTASVEFKKHIQVLIEMRKDLDNIYKRVQTIKSKVILQYPQVTVEIQREPLEEGNSSKASPKEETEDEVEDITKDIEEECERLKKSSSSESLSHDSSINSSESG